MALKPWIEEDKRRGTYAVRWRNAAGKVQRDKGYVWANKADAKKRLWVLHQQQKNNALGIYKKITLEDASVIFRQNKLPKLENDHQRVHCTICWRQINRSFLGKKFIDEIPYTAILEYWESFLKRGCAVSSANRSIMWICSLYECFYKWNQMIPEKMPERVQMPEANPVKLAKFELREDGRNSEKPLARERFLSIEELRQAKAWCLKNSPELWEAMKLAIRTFLRKSDMLKLKAKEQVKGIQGKTKRPFDLPIILDQAVNLTPRAIQVRWNRLRDDLGWKTKGTPLHTTWHDLRHCGPSMLAALNVGPVVIQKILGHATEAQSEKYTHLQRKSLEGPIEAVTQQLDSL